MNKVLPFAAVFALACSSCTTLANRRDLFWPAKPEGPYTEKMSKIHKHEGRTVEKGRPPERTGRHPFRHETNPKW